MQSYTFYVKIYIQNGKKQQVGERMVWLYWFGSYLIGTLITAYFLAKRKGIDLGNEVYFFFEFIVYGLVLPKHDNEVLIL